MQPLTKGDLLTIKSDEHISKNEFGDPSIGFVFKRLKDRTPGEAWIIMVYGASKSGKTYFAGTAGKRTLFINIGEGLATLESPAFTSRYPDSANMIVVDVRDHSGIADGFDKVTTVIDHALAHFPNEFDTVVLDEATAFRKFALNKAMDLNSAQRSTVRGSRKNDYVKAEIGDYGIEMDMIEWFLGEYIPIFKKEGKNFLMIAHERQVYGKPAKMGDEPPLKRILPGFTGKTFPDKVPAFFDDVWRSEVVGKVNKVYRMRTAGDEMEMGGSRHGGVFAVTETDPNFLKMINRIKSSSNLNR